MRKDKQKYEWVNQAEYAKKYPCMDCGKAAFVRTKNGLKCKEHYEKPVKQNNF